MKVLNPIPKNIIKEIETEIYRFLWNPRGIEPINRKTTMLPKEKGGLGILNINIRNQAYQIEQILQIINTKEYRPWMYLFGYKHDYFLHKEFGLKYLSTTHKESISKQSIELRKITKTFIKIKPQQCYDNIKLKQIYNLLVNNEKYEPSVTKRKYKTEQKWKQIFESSAKIKIPNHLYETNYQTVHEYIPNKIYYNRKLNLNHRDNCDLCGNETETTIHIFTKCYPSFYEKLKTQIGETHSLDQLSLDEAPESNTNHLIYSIYRNIILTNYKQKQLDQKKNSNILNYLLKREIQKYMDIFYPP